MSTSTKTRASIRQGGPGASHENAKAPLESGSRLPMTHSADAAMSPAAAVSGIAIMRTGRPTKGAARGRQRRKDKDHEHQACEAKAAE